MKKIVFITLLIFNFIVYAQKDYVENQLLIKFKHQLSQKVTECISKNNFDINLIDKLNHKNQLNKISLFANKQEATSFILYFNNNIDIEKAIKEYQETNLFDYVEPNYIVKSHGIKFETLTTIPNDDLYYQQWSLFNDGSFADQPATPGADISMEEAWEIQTGDSNIVVAVLDTGVKIDHPEFDGRIWENPNEIFSNGSDDDANGYIDDNNGWDFTNNTNFLLDINGHGTNVAGIIAANANNIIGYAGIDWNCKIMTCKVLGLDGTGLLSWSIDAIYYAVDNGANVINMSLGNDSFSSPYQVAVNYAKNNNVVIVASSGNDNNFGISYPARYSNSIAVGSTDADDERSVPFFGVSGSGSNYGSNLDIVAPGGFIYGLDYNSNSNYSNYYGGTSQAAPHVSGVVSLLYAQNPFITFNEVRTILRNTSDDLVGSSAEDITGFDIYHGYGRLNAFRALQDATAGINDLNVNSLFVYPNPVNNELNFNILTDKILNIKIYDITGKLIKQTNINKANSVINIENLTNGIYFIKASNENMTTSLKFIKE